MGGNQGNPFRVACCDMCMHVRFDVLCVDMKLYSGQLICWRLALCFIIHMYVRVWLNTITLL